jgi:hypothetical protein
LYYKIELLQAHWHKDSSTVSAIAQPFGSDGKIKKGTQAILIFYIHNKGTPGFTTCDLPITILSVKIPSENMYFKLVHFTEWLR